jgi:hypothetical protein
MVGGEILNRRAGSPRLHWDSVDQVSTDRAIRQHVFFAGSKSLSASESLSRLGCRKVVGWNCQALSVVTIIIAADFEDKEN